jgi:dsDNA-binding SOS-regulon protein
MKTFRDLDQIFKMTVKWEQEIKDLYDIAAYGVKNEQSKELVIFLKKNQNAHMEILNNLKLKDYGSIEYVQFSFGLHVADEIPVHTITKETPPLEIFENVLKYEEKLNDFYAKVALELVSESQTELFESLAQFKENQVEYIRNYINRNYSDSKTGQK